MFNKLIDRLPDNYNKNENSNIGKLYQIYANELQQIEKAFEDIKIQQDMDKATGKTLDNIGKNVLEYRDSDNDDEYRKWVKIKILANRSDGDIPIINHILETYMEDDFISIEEGWKSYVNEPASLVVNISSKSKYIPFEVLNKIKAAGVRVYFTAGMESSNLILEHKQYDFNVPYRICNRFNTADILGKVSRARVNIGVKTYASEVVYPICNVMRTAAIVSGSRESHREDSFGEIPYNRD